MPEGMLELHITIFIWSRVYSYIAQRRSHTLSEYQGIVPAVMEMLEEPLSCHLLWR